MYSITSPLAGLWMVPGVASNASGSKKRYNRNLNCFSTRSPFYNVLKQSFRHGVVHFFQSFLLEE